MVLNYPVMKPYILSLLLVAWSFFAHNPNQGYLPSSAVLAPVGWPHGVPHTWIYGHSVYCQCACSTHCHLQRQPVEMALCLTLCIISVPVFSLKSLKCLSPMFKLGVVLPPACQCCIILSTIVSITMQNVVTCALHGLYVLMCVYVVTSAVHCDRPVCEGWSLCSCGLFHQRSFPWRIHFFCHDLCLIVEIPHHLKDVRLQSRLADSICAIYCTQCLWYYRCHICHQWSGLWSMLGFRSSTSYYSDAAYSPFHINTIVVYCQQCVHAALLPASAFASCYHCADGTEACWLLTRLSSISLCCSPSSISEPECRPYYPDAHLQRVIMVMQHFSVWPGTTSFFCLNSTNLYLNCNRWAALCYPQPFLQRQYICSYWRFLVSAVWFDCDTRGAPTVLCLFRAARLSGHVAIHSRQVIC